jgi:lysophospholipase L1-like esterase
MASKLLFTARLVLWLLLAGLTLELCARTEDALRYHAPFFGSYSMDSLYRFDELGKYGRPQSSYLKWHLNEFGYRGPSLRNGTYRIAALGSSETFGLYESEQKEWPRQLESMLDHDDPATHYEVVDVSYPGLTVGTALRRLPQMLAAVAPKMVVIYPSYAPYIEISKPTPWPVAQNTYPRVLPDAEHFHWRIADRVTNFIKATLPESLQSRMRSWQLRHDPQSAHTIAVIPDQNVVAFQTDLDHLVTDLRSRGIKVVLVTHASRFGTGAVAKEDAPYLTDWRKFYPQIEESGLLDMERRMSEVVRREAQARNLPLVDAATGIPPGRASFAEFVHFNDSGAHSLASLVAARIEEK